MPRLLSALVMSAGLLTAGLAAALPVTLKVRGSETVLSGSVSGWTLGKRTLAVVDGSPGRVLTRGSIDARGAFQIVLPTPAQLRGLTEQVGQRYDVVGCDDQPSDFAVSGHEAQIYTLPDLKVLRRVPSAGNPFEKAVIRNLPAAGELQLMYASDSATVQVNVTCQSQQVGGQITAAFNLRLLPGWNPVLQAAGEDWRVGNPPDTLGARWVYAVH